MSNHGRYRIWSLLNLCTILFLQKHKHLLLGFRYRTRGYSLLKNGTYIYGSVRDKKLLSPKHKSGYSIILPPIFLHRAYLEMMHDNTMVSKELVDYTDNITNCDDILMSVMVTKFLKDCGRPEGGGLQHYVKSFRTVEGMSKWCCDGA